MGLLKMLKTDDRISLGQCFNLAHNEANRESQDFSDSAFNLFIKNRTISLFKLKKEIEAELDKEYSL